MTAQNAILSFSEIRSQFAQRISQSSAPPAGKVEKLDWNVPHSFSPPAIRKVAKLSRFLGENLSLHLNKELSAEFQLDADVPVQYFSEKIKPTDPELAGFSSLLLQEETHLGFVCISSATGLAWVRRQLGSSDQQPEEEKKGITTLEESILSDILRASVSALGSSLPSTVSPVQCGGAIFENNLPVGDAKCSEFFCLSFRIPDESEPALRFFISSKEILRLSGHADETVSKPKDEIQQQMMSHLKAVSVTLRVELGVARVPVSQIASVERGDVLLLPVETGEPIQVFLREAPIFTGNLVSCNGRYAIQICPPQDEDDSLESESQNEPPLERIA